MFRSMIPVYVSLTTIHDRISAVHETILSILAQDYPVEGIHLYISKEPYLIDKGITEIPTDLQLVQDIDSRLHIHFTENIGPYRKLLPLLREKWKTDCLILTVDDDKIYDKDLISTMVNQYIETNGQYVIANRAYIKWNETLRKLCHNSCGVPNKVCDYIEHILDSKREGQSLAYILGEQYDFISATTFFEGNDGVLYHPKFFTPLVFEWPLIKKYAHTHDDFWFKLCSLINGYGVKCSRPYFLRPTNQLDNTKSSALHFNVNVGSYEKKLRKLINWFFKEKLLQMGVKKMNKRDYPK